jgi:hypothetical protein
MEAKTKKGLIVSGIIIGIIAVVYYLKNKKPNLSIEELKEYIWNYISSANPTSFPPSYKDVYMSSIISSSGKLFMEAWYDAIKNDKPSFVYTDNFNRSATYDTKNGVAK